MGDITQDDFDEPPARRHRLSAAPFIVLGVVIFELTADAALGVVVGCLKFGWDEQATARWLRRHDPDRARGRITARFYTAWSLWRITIVGFAVMLLAIFALEPVRQWQRARGVPVPAVPPEFISATLVAAGGFVLTGLTTAFAILTAALGRVKVWVGPEAKWARKARAWPPRSVDGRSGTTNRAHRLILALVVALAIPLIVAMFAATVELLSIQGWAIGLVMIGLLVGVPIGLFILAAWITPRVVALSPEECWLDRDAFKEPQDDRHDPDWDWPI